MVVIILEKVPTSLRGELSRWMIELKAGVFVGTMNALVREKLWEKVTAKSKGGGCLQVFPARNEQGFSILFHGQTARKVVDMEGLQLVQTKKS